MTAVVAPSQRHHYKRPDSEHEAQATGSETTITTSSGSMNQQREPAKSVFVYLNGDRFYPGRKFVVNRRQLGNFDGFLTEVTRGINPSFGAIRNIYTPINGHRVEELGQIENNMDLVAGGIEKFRRMGYRDITQRPRMMHSPKKASATKAPQKNRMQVPGRWRAYVKEPCQIYVYGNGDIIAPAAKLLFTPRQMKSWDLILQHVTEKLGARTGQAARKLYDLNYHLLHDPSELEAGHFYIAVGSEKLKRLPYGTIPSFNRGHHHISPRRNNAPLPPIKSKSKTRTDDQHPKLHESRKPKQGAAKAEASSTSLARRPHPPPPASEKLEESSVEEIKWWFFKECHKNKGHFVRYEPKRKTAARVDAPPPAAAHQDGDAEEESVFHAKPVKVKRSPQPALDSGEDRDTVFRGQVRGVAADEVGEDADTKIDVPIDHVPAARVDDEVILSARKDNDHDDSLISASKDENANNISQDLPKAANSQKSVEMKSSSYFIRCSHSYGDSGRYSLEPGEGIEQEQIQFPDTVPLPPIGSSRTNIASGSAGVRRSISKILYSYARRANDEN